MSGRLREGPARGRTEAGEPPGCCAPRSVGGHVVLPLLRLLENGWFASSVSIRCGVGSCGTGRVLRLTRLFRCATEATAYARAEALQWIATSPRPLPV